MEFWFYHHSTYPWDTSDFYAEVWTAGSTGPGQKLSGTVCTAAHYTAVTADVYPDVEFWGFEGWTIVNTELSQGSWPSLLGDNTPNSEDHSFFSNDFFVWEPWIMTGSTASDLFIRIDVEYSMWSLSPSTWAGIKGLWR